MEQKQVPVPPSRSPQHEHAQTELIADRLARVLTVHSTCFSFSLSYFQEIFLRFTNFFFLNDRHFRIFLAFFGTTIFNNLAGIP